MLKKVFIAASLIAFMGTAAFAQEPATTQAKPKQETHQVAHKHHHAKASKKESSKKAHTKKMHSAKGTKADSTGAKTNG